jgi:hypothetical protein
MSVTLDDPFESSGGMNPDVIAVAEDRTRWAFALKTLAQGNPLNRAKNLACLVDGAVVQIERAVCDKGAVVVNMKNVLDHEKLRKCVFSSWEHGGAALQAQIESVIQQFYATEADLLRSKFENKSSLAPIVILIAHATVLCYPPGSLKKTFTELKVHVGQVWQRAPVEQLRNTSCMIDVALRIGEGRPA